MKLKHMFSLNACIALIFGLATIFVPIKLYELYGQNIDEFGAALARMWGTGMIGFALITWFSRNLPDSDIRRRIVLAMAIYMSIGFFAYSYNPISLPLEHIDWSTPVIFLLLASGYWWFHFKKSP